MLTVVVAVLSDREGRGMPGIIVNGPEENEASEIGGRKQQGCAREHDLQRAA
jgi:hypothetical protein